MASSNNAWVTLATNDSYSLGALVLAHSLKTVKTVHKLAILITPGVTESMKRQIEGVFDDVKVVDVLDSKDKTHLALMCRPELGVTFTKLHCWTFTKYEKCVFLDADTLVLQNCDELFDRDELSAAPDPGWPDCFNSGVFVYKPSDNTFAQLLEFARTRGSFDGGDQGLLNMFFKDWAHKDIAKHLSFTYNVVWSSTYSYLPALKQFGQNMKIIHFIASSKPWLQSFNTETRLVTVTSGGVGLQSLLQLWWDLFCQHVHPGLSTEMIESRLSSRYSNDFYPEVPSYNNTPYNDYNPNHNYSPINYTSNNYYTPVNNNSNNYYTPVNDNSNNYYTPVNEPPKEHYNFIDPWEEYLVSNGPNDQNHCTVEEEKVYVRQVENVEGGGNVIGVCLDNHCEQIIENNYYVNNCVMEEQKSDYSFQNNVIEECNTYENEEKNNEHYEEEIIECNESKQNENPISIENSPACFYDIPINSNPSLSVNNCRPDSPTYSEVSKDQTCDIDGGLAGHFARVSLGEKTTDQKALEDFLRRQSWEQGNMDYLGRDSFTNIWAKINETLGKTPEVNVEHNVERSQSPPEVVHTEEPKPLKSALKKTSTTILPVESELIVDDSELPTKQLEKLDLSVDILQQSKTPDTPTVTSPTPPITPASQVQESPIPESTKPIEETPTSVVPSEEPIEPLEQESPKTDPVEPIKETLTSEVSTKDSSTPVEQELSKPESVEPVEETQTSVESAEIEKSLPISESTELQADEPIEKVSVPTETVQEPQSSADSVTPLVSNDPPVAPKRTNKGSPPNVPKNVKPLEKK